jgi:hypothetical protein
MILSCQPDDAASVNYEKVAMLLLNNAPELSAQKNKNGTTPLHIICSNSHLRTSSSAGPLTEVILAFNAPPNATDIDGCTPIAIAAAFRDWNLCQILLNAGADINIPCLMKSRAFNGNEGKMWKPMLDDQLICNSLDCTASDLIPHNYREKLFPHISCKQTKISHKTRDRCMNCAADFGSERSGFLKAVLSKFSSNTTGKCSCVHCGRVVCGSCTAAPIKGNYSKLPKFLEDVPAAEKLCILCHSIVTETDY